MLVVIAIIVILAAILFPVFGRARENARKTSCASNMKQLSLGMLQYVQDYDEYFPPQNAGGAAFSQVVQPYVKSTQMMVCPSNPNNAIVARDPLPATTARGAYPAIMTSYAVTGSGFSSRIGVLDFGDFRQRALHISTIESPSLVLAYVESLNRYAEFDPVNGNANPQFNLFAGHLGMSNYAFADGHVKAMKPLATLTPTNLWTRDNRAFDNTSQTNTARAMLARAQTKYN